MASLNLSGYSLPILAVVACLLYLCYRRAICKPISGIAHNKDSAYTLLGDAPSLVKTLRSGGNPFEWTVAQTVKLNSPLVQLFITPLARPWVVVADFWEAQDILLRRTKEFDRSHAIADAFGGVTPNFHFCFTSDDERFKIHRNLLKDLMTPAFLHHVAAPRIHASISNLIKLWTLKAGFADSRPFEAIEDTFNTFIDTITIVAFGLDNDKSVNASRARELANTGDDAKFSSNANGSVSFTLAAKPEIYAALSYLMDSMNTAVRSPMPRQVHWIVRRLPSYHRANRIKEEMISARIEEGVSRMQQGDNTERCALDNVLQREFASAEKAGRAPVYHSRMIRDELLGFLLAGHDTTSSTMTWGFKYLTAYQAVQTKLRSLLHEAFTRALVDGRVPTPDEITKANIPYLEATMEEIHRCGRIFGVALRRVVIDTTILGHHVPEGTDIVLPMIGPSYQTPPFAIPDDLRNESYHTAKNRTPGWDPIDVDTFKPERWLKVDEKGVEYFDANSGPILAFALGPRGCWGRRLAYLQMRILIILVLWNFELQEVEGELGNFEPVERLARQPKNFYLKLKPVER